MSNSPGAVSSHGVKQDPETLVLRSRPRPAVRFRRALIVGVTGAAAAGLVAISWLALEPPSFRRAPAPIDTSEPAGKAADSLENVPRTYGDVPRLGPPLPGDLGRPILEQQRSLDAPALRAAGVAGAEQGAPQSRRERANAERQSARSSSVLVQLDSARAPSGEPAPFSDQGAGAPADPAVPAAAGASQYEKIEFARSSATDRNGDRLRAAPSPWTLTAGTVIPASLVTGLNSDLPGTVLAQVSANVRDSATGRTTLVPQGARLIGNYDSVVGYGQKRALLVWTRIVFPDGSSVGLDNMPATDVSGEAGLEDQVDTHTWQLLKGIALSTLLGVSSQLSLGGGGDIVRAIRESTQQNAANAGDRITSRNLDVQPTIRVRPGWPVLVFVNKDLVLQPWRK